MTLTPSREAESHDFIMSLTGLLSQGGQVIAAAICLPSLSVSLARLISTPSSFTSGGTTDTGSCSRGKAILPRSDH